MVKNNLLSDFQKLKDKVANKKQFEQELIKIGKQTIKYYRTNEDYIIDTLIFDWLIGANSKYDDDSIFDIFNRAYQIVMQEELYIQSSNLNVFYPQLLAIFDVCIKFAKNAIFY